MKLIPSFVLMLLIASSAGAQTFSVLFNFNADQVGRSPNSQLVQDSAGMLYGERFNGVGNSYGTVYAIHANGTGFTNLFSFNYNDGGFPEGGLLLSGNVLYGTASQGENGDGTVFALNTDGTGFTNLYNFSNTDGATPETALILSATLFTERLIAAEPVAKASFLRSTPTVLVLPTFLALITKTAGSPKPAWSRSEIRFMALLMPAERTVMGRCFRFKLTVPPSPIFAASTTMMGISRWEPSWHPARHSMARRCRAAPAVMARYSLSVRTD